MAVSFVCLMVTVVLALQLGTGDAGFGETWLEKVCEQNDAVLGEICSCYQYLPQRTMSALYICMDKHVPNAGRQIPRFYQEVCQDRSLYTTVHDCIVVEDEGAMQQYRDEGGAHVECTKAVFAKYQIDFEFPEIA